MSNINKILHSNLLLIPVISHWILPERIEQKMYLDILGLPFYVFGFCYILYILLYRKYFTGYPFKLVIRDRVKSICICFLFLSFLLGLVNSVDGLFYLMIDNQAFIFSALIFLLYPLNKGQVELTKYVIIPASLILCFEIMLYSLGILMYTETLSNEEYGSFMRISTTIGAATGSAFAISSLGACCLCCYNYNKIIRYGLAVVITATLFMCMSRATVLVWGLFCSVFFYKQYLSKTTLRSKIKAFFILIIVLMAVNKTGVFDAVFERQKFLEENGIVDTGRDELRNQAFAIIKNSSYIGVGPGQIVTDKSLHDIVNPSYRCGVHNFYIVQLAETGILGFLLIICLLLLVVKNLDYSNSLSIFVILQLLIGFNTDYCWIEYEYIPIFFFIVNLSLRTKKTVSHKIYDNN